MDLVVEDLLAADDDEKMYAQLRQDGIRDALVDHDASGVAPPSTSWPVRPCRRRRGSELSDAEWQMLLRRCPSRSLTVETGRRPGTGSPSRGRTAWRAGIRSVRRPR
jgi:hypothetical protein